MSFLTRQRRHLASSMHDQRRAIVDAVVIAFVMATAFWVIERLDLFGKLDYVVENRKQSLIDECIVVAVLSVFGLLVFSVRRMMDQQREIRLRHQAEDRAAHLALADALTGLPNRRQFESRLLASIARFSGNESAFALMMIDLDRFKPVNDVFFGHGVGDQVLIAFAKARLRGRRPRSNARPLRRRRIRAPRRSDRGSAKNPRASRGGCRGFPPAVRGQRNAGDAGNLDRNHSRAARRDYGGRTDAPRGYRPLSRQGHGPQHVLLLREGDGHPGQEAGEDRARPPSGDRDGSGARRGSSADRRPRDRPDHRFRGARPLVPSRIRRVGARAVYRRRRRRRTDHPAFGASAVHRGARRHKMAIGRQAVLQHFARATRRSDVGVAHSQDLQKPGSARPGSRSRSASRRWWATSPRAEALDAFHKVGVRIALDDFGTGNSSLQHLRACHFDRLKIDRSFVMSMPGSAENTSLVNAILGLSKALGLPVTAEGIETEALIWPLRDGGCAEGQGFRF